MLKLPVENLIDYELFKNGFRVVRRSDRNWAWCRSSYRTGFNARSLKTRRGLTQGSGFSEV